jgi:hypothetical protein
VNSVVMPPSPCSIWLGLSNAFSCEDPFEKTGLRRL